jgi:hypothetical protein
VHQPIEPFVQHNKRAAVPHAHDACSYVQRAVRAGIRTSGRRELGHDHFVRSLCLCTVSVAKSPCHPWPILHINPTVRVVRACKACVSTCWLSRTSSYERYGGNGNTYGVRMAVAVAATPHFWGATQATDPPRGSEGHVFDKLFNQQHETDVQGATPAHNAHNAHTRPANGHHLHAYPVYRELTGLLGPLHGPTRVP